MKRLIVTILIVAAVNLPVSAVLASVISGAEYVTNITVTNNTTDDSSAVAAVLTLSTSDMIDSDMLNATATDAAMHSPGAVDTAFMPGYSTNPWCLWVPVSDKQTVLNYYLYSSGVTGGKIRYFPGSGGMTTDDAGLVISDNFTMMWDAFFNTDAGANKHIGYKQDAIDVYVSDTVSGNITAVINNENATKTATLIPVGVGNETAIATVSGAATHWEANLTNDGDTSYVQNTSTQRDLFTCQDMPSLAHPELVEIDSVTVYIVAKYNVAGQTAACSVRTNGTSYNGGYESLTAAYATYSKEWVNNPQTSAAWTLDEVNAMEIGVQLAFVSNTSRCTQVYAEVVYREMPVVTLLNVDFDEHVLTVSMASPYFGIAIDGSALLPVEDNGGDLVLNAPLWQQDCDSDPFYSIDSYQHECDVNDAVWSSSGYTFDGTNDYIEIVGDTSTLDFTIEYFTIIVWVTTPDTTNPQTLFSRGLVWNDGYFMQIGAAGRIVLTTNQGGSIDNNYTAPGVVTTNAWHQLVAIRSGTSALFYKNGESVAVETPDAITNPLTSARTPKIGVSDNLADDLTGSIGEITIYNRTLSAAEILQNYNATKWKYEGDTDRMVISTLAEVPSNAYDWYFCQNDSVMYLESQEITIGGSPAQSIEWEYGAIFNDTSGNNNDATPTFRTSSSDADVIALISSQYPVAEQGFPEVATTGGWLMIGEVPSTLGSLLDEGGTDWPGAVEVKAVADDTRAVSANGMFYILAFATAGIAGIGAYATTHRTRMGVRGSLILMCLTIECVLCVWVFGGGGVIAGFVLIPFGIISFLLIIIRSPQSPVVG